MKALKSIAALTLTLALATTSAWAAGPYRPAPRPVAFSDTARVVSSTPVYEEVNEPRRECWSDLTDRSYENRERSYGGAILGAIVGGVVGHQFGKGGGKDAATGVGAAIGAITGDNIDNQERVARRRPVEEERCQVVDNWSRRIVGYDVVYRYQGNEFNTFLPYEPGRTLRVRVNVSVDER